MAVYGITRFAAPNMDTDAAFSQTVSSALQGLNADFIDVVSYGNGKGVVIAKYENQAKMDSAAAAASEAFDSLMKAGMIEADSVHPHAGTVICSA